MSHRINQGEQMTDETSSLTVTKLKALCVINDLATSGKKAELVDRLLEAGLSRNEVGLSESESTPEPVEEAKEEEVVLSLEDETTISIEEDEPESIEEPEEDVLEAVLVADVVDEESEEVFTPAESKRQDAATLADMIKNPKVIAVIIVSLFLGAAGWWYINSSLEPFTAEPLRYGDTMEYSITGGLGDRPAIMASEGFLDLVFNFLEPDDDYCRIFMDYQGRGTLAVSQGTSQDLVGMSSQSLLGAVRSQGPYGSNDWLAVEISNTYDFDDFDIGRNTYSIINQGSCPEAEDGAYVPGEAVLTTKRHIELKEQVTLSTAFDFSATIDNKPYEGSAKTFDVGGLLGSLDVLLPGVSLMLQPIELQDLFATDVIEEGATGERLGSVSYTHLTLPTT